MVVIEQASSQRSDVPEVAIEALRVQLRGALIGPKDATYESARQLYNGMIDKRPR